MRKELFQNLAVLTISLGGAAYCADLLYQDFHSRSSATGHTPAGSLSGKTQTVKRKYGDNLLWEPVDISETLYWNDAIQTADASTASISLEDGNTIMLGESSLVVLEHDNEHLSLSLKSGQLLVDSSHAKARAATIKVNGTSVEERQGEKLTLAVDDTKHEVVAVQSKTDGSAQEMKIDKQGHVEEVELPVLLNNPAPLSRLYNETKEALVSFQWQAAPSSHQTLEVARDRDFKNIVAKKDNTSDKADISLQTGIYYWRVTVSKQDAKQPSMASEIRSFEVVQTTKPVLTTLEKNPVTYHGDAPVIEFNWQGNASAGKYVWELSDSQDFKNVLSSGETTTTTYRTADLKSGHLFWRVSAVYGERSIASVPSTLEVKKLPEPVPPSELFPETGVKISYEDFEKNQGLLFHWKKSPTENYRFVFSKSQDLKDEITSFETSQDQTLLKDKLKPGTYYWSVGYKDDAGHWVYPETHTMEVSPLIPLLAAPALMASASQAELNLLKNPHVKWEWKPVSGAKRYHFKLVKTDGGKQEVVLDEMVKSNENEKNDLPDGQYQWMVSSVDEFGRESQSSPVDFKVIHGKPLDAPNFDMPEVQ